MELILRLNTTRKPSVGEPVISSSWVNERRSLVFLSASEVAEKMDGGVLDAWAESIK